VHFIPIFSETLGPHAFSVLIFSGVRYPFAMVFCHLCLKREAWSENNASVVLARPLFLLKEGRKERVNEEENTNNVRQGRMKKEQSDTCPKTSDYAHPVHFLQHQGSSKIPPVVPTPQMLNVAGAFRKRQQCRKGSNGFLSRHLQ
jgi:hypothetical protein